MGYCDNFSLKDNLMIKRMGHKYIDAATGTTLDVWFPKNNRKIERNCLAKKVGLITSKFVEVEIESYDSAPQSTEDAYLRLHLLSECQVQPNNINLDGIFALLPNIAWTSAGPVLPVNLNALREKMAAECHHLSVTSID
jgi:2,3,4,5-tetrahydropyridine-2-carboxylate N-succinyltransferase